MTSPPEIHVEDATSLEQAHLNSLLSSIQNKTSFRFQRTLRAEMRMIGMLNS